MKTMTKEEKKIRTEQTLSFLKDLKKMDTEDRRKNMMKLIVSYNMSIVEVEVNKILRMGYDQSYSKEELFNEGILGLYDAIKNFDCEKSGDSFYTYASLYVKGQIFTFVTNNASINLHLFYKCFQINIHFILFVTAKTGSKNTTIKIIRENMIKLWSNGKYSILSSLK